MDKNLYCFIYDEYCCQMESCGCILYPCCERCPETIIKREDVENEK